MYRVRVISLLSKHLFIHLNVKLFLVNWHVEWLMSFLSLLKTFFRFSSFFISIEVTLSFYVLFFVIKMCVIATKSQTSVWNLFTEFRTVNNRSSVIFLHVCTIPRMYIHWKNWTTVSEKLEPMFTKLTNDA